MRDVSQRPYHCVVVRVPGPRSPTSHAVALALLLGRFAATLLYGIRATDPFSIGAAVLVLITVTMIAGFVPAMRAGRVDPLAALRED